VSFLVAGALSGVLGWSAAPARGDEVEICADAAEAGQKLALARKHIEAKQAFVRCVQESCPAEIRDVCGPLLEESKARIAHVTVRVRSADGKDVVDAVVLLDARPFQPRVDAIAREIDPGVYRFRAKAGALQSEEIEAAIAEGERRSIDLVLDAPPPAGGPATRGPGPAPWIVGGVGLASLTTFAVLQGVAQSRRIDLEETCGVTGTCDPTEVDSVDAQLKASVVMLGVGAAAVAASAILFIALDDTIVSAGASPTSVSAGLTLRL
jgi:hypothetical protein